METYLFRHIKYLNVKEVILLSFEEISYKRNVNFGQRWISVLMKIPRWTPKTYGVDWNDWSNRIMTYKSRRLYPLSIIIPEYIHYRYRFLGILCYSIDYLSCKLPSYWVLTYFQISLRANERVIHVQRQFKGRRRRS